MVGAASAVAVVANGITNRKSIERRGRSVSPVISLLNTTSIKKLHFCEANTLKNTLGALEVAKNFALSATNYGCRDDLCVILQLASRL